MYNLLLVSATTLEIEPTLKFLAGFDTESKSEFQLENLRVEICITGVGMVNTAFMLGRLSHKKYNIVINAGVAGSFSKYKIGDIVNVINDCFSELGAEDDQNFLSVDKLGLGEQNVRLINSFDHPLISGLPKVNAITVNTVHGEEKSIQKVSLLYNPDIESMEGAAFMLAANHNNWQAIQLRAISNQVEKRNKNNWDMTLAISNLNQLLIDIIKTSASKLDVIK